MSSSFVKLPDSAFSKYEFKGGREEFKIIHCEHQNKPNGFSKKMKLKLPNVGIEVYANLTLSEKPYTQFLTKRFCQSIGRQDLWDAANIPDEEIIFKRGIAIFGIPDGERFLKVMEWVVDETFLANLALDEVKVPEETFNDEIPF